MKITLEELELEMDQSWPSNKVLRENGVDLPKRLDLIALFFFKTDATGLTINSVREALIELSKQGFIKWPDK